MLFADEDDAYGSWCPWLDVFQTRESQKRFRANAPGHLKRKWARDNIGSRNYKLLRSNPESKQGSWKVLGTFLDNLLLWVTTVSIPQEKPAGAAYSKYSKCHILYGLYLLSQSLLNPPDDCDVNTGTVYERLWVDITITSLSMSEKNWDMLVSVVPR